MTTSLYETNIYSNPTILIPGTYDYYIIFLVNVINIGFQGTSKETMIMYYLFIIYIYIVHFLDISYLFSMLIKGLFGEAIIILFFGLYIFSTALIFNNMGEWSDIKACVAYLFSGEPRGSIALYHDVVGGDVHPLFPTAGGIPFLLLDAGLQVCDARRRVHKYKTEIHLVTWDFPSVVQSKHDLVSQELLVDMRETSEEKKL